MGNGSGNGVPPSTNDVDATYAIWRSCRANIEAAYPVLVDLRVFDGIEAFMVVIDVEDQARHLGGSTWLLMTPDGYWPVLSIYFSYEAGKVVLRAAYADEP